MSAPVPDLPVLPEDDSMLTRKFGREVANYFSGSPLNRVSFLRTNYGFLAAAFAHPTTRILPMNGLAWPRWPGTRRSWRTWRVPTSPR